MSVNITQRRGGKSFSMLIHALQESQRDKVAIFCNTKQEKERLEILLADIQQSYKTTPLYPITFVVKEGADEKVSD